MDPQNPIINPTGDDKDNGFVGSGTSSNVNDPSDTPNAFTALSDKIGGPVAQNLNSADVPKKLAEYNAIKSVIASIIVFIAGIVVAAITYNRNHNRKDLLLILIATIVISGLIFVISYISYRQLKNAQKQPATFNQFQTGTAVSYKTPLTTATIAADEVVGSWLGPVNTGGKQGISVQVLNHESDHQAINTLLFTNKQVIAVLLGPQDAPASLAGGLLNQVASSAVQYSDEGANAKNEEFVVMYARKWDAMVQNLLSQGLQTLPQNHLTYGIPFDQIEHVEVRRSLINPGLIFYLRDGKKLTYPTLRKDLLDQAQNYLQQYLQVH
jgi:hypothetical protein